MPARPSDASHAIAFGKIPVMEHVVRVFSSFDEAEQADAEFYANLTRHECGCGAWMPFADPVNAPEPPPQQ